MKKLVTRDREDSDLYTISLSSSNTFEIFEAYSETYADLVDNTSEAIIASEELELHAETLLELLSEFAEFLIQTHEEDITPAICQCLIGTSPNNITLYAVIHYQELWSEADVALEEITYDETEDLQVVTIKLRVKQEE